jgi:histidine triad (HIT) family protein
MVADCIFCRIAAGDEPAQVICRDDRVMALVDICPIRPGHTLIIPHRHHPYFDDLPPTTASRIVHLGQRLAKAMKRLYAVPRVGFVFTGADHPHVHAHVVPLHDRTDITSRRYITERRLTFGPAPRAPRAELTRTAGRLRAALAKA